MNRPFVYNMSLVKKKILKGIVKPREVIHNVDISWQKKFDNPTVHCVINPENQNETPLDSVPLKQKQTLRKKYALSCNPFLVCSKLQCQIINKGILQQQLMHSNPPFYPILVFPYLTSTTLQWFILTVSWSTEVLVGPSQPEVSECVVPQTQHKLQVGLMASIS